MPTDKSLTKVLNDWNEIQFGWIAAIILGAMLLIYVVKRVVPWVAAIVPDRFRFWILPWEPVLRLVILMVAFVQIVPLIIKPTTENVVAVVGAMAIALGFAFKDYASSVIAGVVSIFERPYRPGDWVRVDEVYGEVETLGLRAMTMITPDDTRVSVPHAKIWDTAILNDNAGRLEMMCVADFYLHPEHDGEAVRRILWDVAITSAYLHHSRDVVVIVSEKPWGTHYRLKAYPIDSRDQFQFVTDLTIRGKAELMEAGIPFAAAAAVPDAAEASP